MRKGGIEPPRVLPHRNLKPCYLSVSIDDSTISLRQDASQNDTLDTDIGAPPPNLEGGGDCGERGVRAGAEIGADAEAENDADAVATALTEALCGWREDEDVTQLRRRLLDLLRALEG